MQPISVPNPTVNILIIDRDPDNLCFLAAVLMQEGYNVRKALDEQTALMACRILVPDIILLDIMVPSMDSYSICEKLKKHPSTQRIPIIFLSTIDDVLAKVKAFQAGGVDYITKPFQAEEVMVRIKNQLNLKSTEKELFNLNSELEKKVQELTLQLEIANQKLAHEFWERQQLQQKLWHMAWHDSLTHLPNRAFLIEQLEKELEKQKKKEEYCFSLLFLDCDRFKLINDSLGHMVGDQLLVAFGARLRDSAPKKATVARLGGDEFAIILPEVTDIQSVRQLAEELVQALRVPFQIAGMEIFVTASIGVVFSHSNYQNPQQILHNADTAMYRAKSQGTSHFCIFASEIYERAMKALYLDLKL